MKDREFGLEICQALGVDPTSVVKLVLTVDVHQMPTLDVTSVVVSDEDIDGDRVVEVLSQYELRPR